MRRMRRTARALEQALGWPALTPPPRLTAWWAPSGPLLHKETVLKWRASPCEFRAEKFFSLKGLNMYAVIKTGGKQYKVAAGEKIKVEQIAADVGQEIVIDQVLAVGS